ASRLCSCTTIVTAAPDARISRARAMALSSSGRVTARVEIFSAKIRVTPEAFSESAWVSSDCRTVDARAFPIRTCPAGAVPTAGGRGSSVQAEPGLRTGGDGAAGGGADRPGQLRAFGPAGPGPSEPPPNRAQPATEPSGPAPPPCPGRSGT